MAKPTQIRDAMETWLTSETGIAATPRPYIEDVNDFPAINVWNHSGKLVINHYGAGAKLKSYFVSVRAYVWSEDDSIAESERVCYLIERAIEGFAAAHRALNIQSAQVTEVHTDEGLFTPYGVVDLNLAILYND